ncbi:MAG: SDR family oxidoreductase [Acetobacteraceae bacterium]|nr:SDR family oxidoreductase [Acetobacteraceae bacterium]
MTPIHTDIPATIPRAALVTGAARRVGRSIAIALAQAGFDLALHCHTSRKACETTAEEIRALGCRAEVVQTDLADEAQTSRLVPGAAEAIGPLGVLVNNASVFERDEWHDTTRASWDAHLEPNLRAPFMLIQHFARRLPEGAEGVVVNMLDQRVWSLTPHFVSYTLSKAALWALTQTMALALAPRIRVNGIGPGPSLPNSRQTPQQFARQAASVPLRHGAPPEEIGRAVIFILGMPSMTGQMIALDGGQHLQWSSTRTDPPVGGE